MVSHQRKGGLGKETRIAKMDEQPSQVGGGYSLRANLKTTPNAAKPSHDAKKRRAKPVEQPQFENPQPSTPFDTISQYLGHDLDEETFNAMFVDDDHTPMPHTPTSFSAVPTQGLSDVPGNVPAPDNTFSVHDGPDGCSTPAHAAAAPATSSVLPPHDRPLTPASPLSPIPSSSFDSDSDNENQPRKGRISNAHREILNKAFQAIDNIFDQTSSAIDRPVNNLISLWQKDHAHKRPLRTMWNKYQHFFRAYKEVERTRAGLPAGTSDECWKSFQLQPDYQKILDTHDELRNTEEMQTTLLDRARRFNKLTTTFKAMANKASSQNGFETIVIMVGNCILEDSSLNFVYSSPGAEMYLNDRLGADDDMVCGLLKTHVANEVAIGVTRDLVARRESSKKSDDDPFMGPSELQNPSAPDTGEEEKVGEAGEAGERAYNACRDKIAITIKNAMRAAGGDLEGDHLPWIKLPKKLAEQKLILVNWPLGVDFPGEHSRGLKKMGTPKIRLLVAACSSPSTMPHCCVSKDPLAVSNSEQPVFMTARPAADSPHPFGRRGFVDGRFDWNGLPRVEFVVPGDASQPVPQVKGKGKAPAPPGNSRPKPAKSKHFPTEDDHVATKTHHSDDDFVDASSTFSRSPSPIPLSRTSRPVPMTADHVLHIPGDPALRTQARAPSAAPAPLPAVSLSGPARAASAAPQPQNTRGQSWIRELSIAAAPLPAITLSGPAIKGSTSSRLPEHSNPVGDPSTKRAALLVEGSQLYGTSMKKPRTNNSVLPSIDSNFLIAGAAPGPPFNSTANAPKRPTPRPISKLPPNNSVHIGSSQGFVPGSPMPEVKQEADPSMHPGWPAGPGPAGSYFAGPGYPAMPGYSYPGPYPPGYPPHPYYAAMNPYHASHVQEGPYAPAHEVGHSAGSGPAPGTFPGYAMAPSPYPFYQDPRMHSQGTALNAADENNMSLED